MNLSWVDWTIMLVAVVALRFISLSTRSYMKSVADFLSANRSAGRYLLTIANQMGGVGVISFVAMFEAYMRAGFPPVWWQLMLVPVASIIALTGWVYYRFRETRALTLAQFFEMRYSRKFRVFAGFLCWATGVLNFGIFPAVAARFFIYFCGLPDHFHIPGINLALSTFPSVMVVDLAFALTFVTMGGQISVMITECVQGIFACFAFVIVTGVVLVQLHWARIVVALNTAPANASMLHPFHTSQVKDFNVWYFLIGLFSAFYSYMTWQANSGFNSAARTPHEQKMGGIIAIWRFIPQGLMTIVLAIAAYAVLHLPEFSYKAAIINASLSHISNPAIQSQMRVPIALANFLPTGIKGLLATVMLFASFTCTDSYMHSWGSIFIQDVYMPLRKRCLDTQEHIRLLRWSIIGVAVFAFFFSLYYPPNCPILMFFAITGTIWVAGSGAAIIGGLYWKRGTTAAAYSALIFGAIVGVGGLVYPQMYQNHFHKEFPVNGMWLYFFGMCGAALVYAIVSLLTHKQWKQRAIVTAAITATAGMAVAGIAAGLMPRMYRLLMNQDQIVRWTVISFAAAVLYTLVCVVVCRNVGYEFNLEKMLCRGKYAKSSTELSTTAEPSRLQQLVGITKEFSLGDKVLAIALVLWNAAWVALFLVVTLINLAVHISTEWWTDFWHYYVWIYFVMSVPITIWFAVGGVIDIKGLFKTLAATVRDDTDDGRVVHESDAQPISVLIAASMQDVESISGVGREEK